MSELEKTVDAWRNDILREIHIVALENGLFSSLDIVGINVIEHWYDRQIHIDGLLSVELAQAKVLDREECRYIEEAESEDAFVPEKRFVLRIKPWIMQLDYPARGKNIVIFSKDEKLMEEVYHTIPQELYAPFLRCQSGSEQDGYRIVVGLEGKKRITRVEKMFGYEDKLAFTLYNFEEDQMWGSLFIVKAYNGNDPTEVPSPFHIEPTKYSLCEHLGKRYPIADQAAFGKIEEAFDACIVTVDEDEESVTLRANMENRRIYFNEKRIRGPAAEKRLKELIALPNIDDLRRN